MQKLVFEARQDNTYGKTNGVLRVADMVRYSAHMNRVNSQEYPEAYNKDAWSTYGKVYIDRANTLPTKKVRINNINFDIPNISELVSKYNGSELSLLKYLLPIEKLINITLEELFETKDKLEKLSDENSNLKQTIKKYELLTLAMAHEGSLKIYRERYGIKNVLSIEENKESFNDLDKLDEFFTRSVSGLQENKDKLINNSDSNIGQKILSLRGNNKGESD